MHKQKTFRERRRNPRIDFELKLRISNDEKFTSSRADDCVITDITKTGLGLISRHKFEVCEQLWMRFELMEGLLVTIFGEIYWRKWNNMYYCYGSKFLKVSWLSQRNLDRGLISRYFPTTKSKTRSILEYALLILLVVLLTRFLSHLSLAYTLGILICFLAIFYVILIRTSR